MTRKPKLEIEHRDPLVHLYFVQEIEVETQHDSPCMGLTTNIIKYENKHRYFSTERRAEDYAERLKTRIAATNRLYDLVESTEGENYLQCPLDYLCRSLSVVVGKETMELSAFEAAGYPVDKDIEIEKIIEKNSSF